MDGTITLFTFGCFGESSPVKCVRHWIPTVCIQGRAGQGLLYCTCIRAYRTVSSCPYPGLSN